MTTSRRGNRSRPTGSIVLPTTILKRAVSRGARAVGLEVRRWPAEDRLRLLAAVIARYGIDTLLDVGANEGQFAAQIRSLGFTGDIVSFEPVPSARVQLNAASSADPRWTVRSEALGDEEAILSLNVSRATVLSSFLPYGATLATPNSHPFARVTETLDVPVKRLAGLWDELALERAPARRIMLKTDTEGFDLRVLRGAEPHLSSVSCLFVEMAVIPAYDGASNSFLDCWEYIISRGFELAGLFPVARDGRLRVHELDGLFVRADDAFM